METPIEELSKKFNFLTNYVEEKMYLYWPHPTRDFYCRSCNYIEFPDNESLLQHKQTKQHMAFEESEKEAFCFICQCHVFDKSMMDEHRCTKRHHKMADLFDQAKKEAQLLWNKKNCAKDHVSINNNLHQIETNIKVKINNTNPASPEHVTVDNLSSPTHCDDDVTMTCETTNEKYPEDMKIITERIDAFIIKHKEAILAEDSSFNPNAISYALQVARHIPDAEHFCKRCNKQFDHVDELNRHLESYRHKKNARSKYFCNSCFITFSTEKEFKEHKRTKSHIKLSILYNKCRSKCRTKVKSVLKTHRERKKTYRYMCELLYPKNKIGLLYGDYCLACQCYFKDKYLHIKEYMHQRILRSYYQNLKKEVWVSSEGCAVCEVKAEDNFDPSLHEKLAKHRHNVDEYQKLIGLIENSEEKDRASGRIREKTSECDTDSIDRNNNTPRNGTAKDNTYLKNRKRKKPSSKNASQYYTCLQAPTERPPKNSYVHHESEDVRNVSYSVQQVSSNVYPQYLY